MGWGIHALSPARDPRGEEPACHEDQGGPGTQSIHVLSPRDEHRCAGSGPGPQVPGAKVACRLLPLEVGAVMGQRCHPQGPHGGEGRMRPRGPCNSHPCSPHLSHLQARNLLAGGDTGPSCPRLHECSPCWATRALRGGVQAAEPLPRPRAACSSRERDANLPLPIRTQATGFWAQPDLVRSCLNYIYKDITGTGVSISTYLGETQFSSQQGPWLLSG